MVSFVIAHFMIWQNPNTRNREDKQKSNNVKHCHVGTSLTPANVIRCLMNANYLAIKHALGQSSHPPLLRTPQCWLPSHNPHNLNLLFHASHN